MPSKHKNTSRYDSSLLKLDQVNNVDSAFIFLKLLISMSLSDGSGQGAWGAECSTLRSSLGLNEKFYPENTHLQEFAR